MFNRNEFFCLSIYSVQSPKEKKENKKNKNKENKKLFHKRICFNPNRSLDRYSTFRNYPSVTFTNIPRQLTKEMEGDDRIAYLRLLGSMSFLKKHTNRKQPRDFVVTFLHSGEVEMSEVTIDFSQILLR